ncbi:BPK_HP2_G0032630.mRNA.1.CDS.1 [Saccharomyces cerevisiae]|nr:BPK_HP2_G0032630.mRNA.1.CDS.1 [Saccharomyces cerevisiae]CAI6592823.1 BPK_HP1_G0034060.mRNA.1.CDS.1 [Saccharomyces cerevisiae]CAI6622942.1 BPK_HP2_G0032630.mRNA.1.CDS.1 [Saccharomyces cerevisiae]CAI7356002.1 BPK_collapsed_G0034380.mRNA.1.CDS.1 [Saccharomyces cerevisiae]
MPETSVQNPLRLSENENTRSMFLSASQQQRPSATPSFPRLVRNTTANLSLSDFQVLNPSSKRQNSNSVYDDINSSKRRISRPRFSDIEGKNNDHTYPERTTVKESEKNPSPRYVSSSKRALKRENSVGITQSSALISKSFSENGGSIAHEKWSPENMIKPLNVSQNSLAFQEIELQERCSQLTNSQTTELKSLWTIYKINTDLVNNYVTFITTALLPSQPPHDLVIGQEIVEIYRIERRLWVYGSITFLDVLKNFSNFMDPEVCCQFITHVFVSLSTMISDIPSKYSITWLQRLGDLSRMAIALYPSSFIDWKLSAEHWYTEAMKYIYNHGKLYYHMSTVQQNTLEAFVNLGKSVFCQETFTPSPQYMQLVIDNIYQRAFVERNNGNLRNSLLIEYLKHSEAMLLPSFLESPDLQNVVLSYFIEKFGIDANGCNIFNAEDMFVQNPDFFKYFFRHGPSFAQSHILQIVGFGEPKNPFAILFELPKYLKERKDKKERKKSSNNDSSVTESSTGNSRNDNEDDDEIMSSTTSISDHDLLAEFFNDIDTLRRPILPSMLTNEAWLETLKFLNMTSLKCGIIVLQKFLHGPLGIALPHILPWIYFIISICLKSSQLSDPVSKEFWMIIVKRAFPWDTMVTFMNVLIVYLLDNQTSNSIIGDLCDEYDKLSLSELLELFNEGEELPEILGCWGTLWFDTICEKNTHSISSEDNFQEIGIKDYMALDSPTDGIIFDEKDENGEKFWKRACRTIFLFRELSRSFPIGVIIRNDPLIYRSSFQNTNILGSLVFKLEPLCNIHNNIPVLGALESIIDISEARSENNTDLHAVPELSVNEGDNIFHYVGYKKLRADYTCFDKNGEFLSASLYTTWYVPNSNNTNIEDNINYNSEKENEGLFLECIKSDYPEIDFKTTYFVFDATSWLRHSARIFKLAQNRLLRFAICLTTFQELRFLRKSKDENVMEAATRGNNNYKAALL